MQNKPITRKPKYHLESQVFGRLTVLRRSTRQSAGKAKHTYWLCRCKCGIEKEVLQSHLIRNLIKSCGCLMRESVYKYIQTHGQTKTSEYQIWAGIIKRCENPRCRAFHNYGGRGITMCNRWRNDFTAFYADLGKRPSSKHEVDRKNNEGGYWCGKCEECKTNTRPANCRWATRHEQMTNTRFNRLITFDGRTQTLGEWATEKGMQSGSLARRLNAGWLIEEAMNLPIDGNGWAARKGRTQVIDTEQVNAALSSGILPARHDKQ